jgi:hypothetical protein
MATPHLWPSVRTVSSLRHNGPTGLGLTVDEGLLTSTGGRLANPYCGSDLSLRCRELYTRLHAVGFYNDSHPYSHYWPLQWVATGIVLALTALAVLTAFRLLTRQVGAAPKKGRR